MANHTPIRPIERCVLRMSADGLGDDEIGRRLRRSPAHVEQVRRLAHVPRHPTPPATTVHRLRPLERRILRWLAHGAERDHLAAQFGRSPAFVDFVEQMAAYKLRR